MNTLKSLTFSIILSLVFSCGTKKKVQVKSLLADSFVTYGNDTIPTKHRIVYNLRVGDTYVLIMRKGRCVDVTKRIKEK